jgi:NTE family protein
MALERMQVLRLLDPTFGRDGLFKGERIMGVLRELIGDCDIEDLQMSFTAVATDLESGDEVWLHHGKLFDAIRASIATPLVFTPFKHGARTLLDGALVNPVPVAPTLNDDTDLTVAVNLSGPAASPPEPPASSSVVNVTTRGLLDIAFVSMQTMQDTISRLRLAAYTPDVMVDIPRDACGFYEFWRAEELIQLGRERTAQAFAKVECQ